jgi:hypothetical protein
MTPNRAIVLLRTTSLTALRMCLLPSPLRTVPPLPRVLFQTNLTRLYSLPHQTPPSLAPPNGFCTISITRIPFPTFDFPLVDLQVRSTRKIGSPKPASVLVGRVCCATDSLDVARWLLTPLSGHLSVTILTTPSTPTSKLPS